MAVRVRNIKPKPGYKETEVGSIPEDWEIAEFRNLIDYVKGFAFKSADYRNDGVRVIRVSDTTFDSIENVNQIYIDYDKAQFYNTWALHEYDLIISTVGSKPPMYDSMVGKSLIIEKRYEGTLLNQNAVLVRSKKRETYKQILLLNHFRTKRYLNYIASIFRGNANQASITLNDLFHFQVALPRNDAEQRAIATALSDVDALIASLNKLIAKKRAIKQATMQQLLTGKRRLPGFSENIKPCYKQTEIGEIPEDWELVPLGRISAFITKGATPTTYGFNWVNEGILFLRSECVSEQGLDFTQSMFITPEAHIVLKRSEVRAGDILITITGNVGRVIYLGDAFQSANINQHIARIRVTDVEVANNYIFHFLSQFIIRKYYNSIVTGQAYPQISLKQVRETPIPLPPTKSEQAAIATVLSDMDAEIVALEKRRDKVRALKQGMMQELLTGKTRLV